MLNIFRLIKYYGDGRETNERGPHHPGLRELAGGDADVAEAELVVLRQADLDLAGRALGTQEGVKAQRANFLGGRCANPRRCPVRRGWNVCG